MPSTYTARSKIEKQAYDENSETWGQKLDDSYDKFDYVMNGLSTVDVSDGPTITLSWSDGKIDDATARAVKFVGSISQDTTIVVPSVEKLTVYINNTTGAHHLFIRTNSGDPVEIVQGKRALLYCDGVNHEDALTMTLGDLVVGGQVSAQNLSEGSALSIAQGGTGASTIEEAYANLTPPGVIQMYAGKTAPQGWLFCDGAAVSRSIYIGLFTVIGTIFGAGDLTSTFNVPDFRGRVPLGVGAGLAGLTARTLGETGGSETVQLTVDHMPSHFHDIVVSFTTDTDGMHAHGGFTEAIGDHTHFTHAGGSLQTAGGGAIVYGGTSEGQTGAAGGHSHIIDDDGDHTHTATINDQTGAFGGDQAHPNMQPYLAINFIIKV